MSAFCFYLLDPSLRSGGIHDPPGNWSNWQHIAWGSGGGWLHHYWVDAGVVLSEATHDTHPNNAEYIANVQPTLDGEGVLTDLRGSRP